jgi:Fic family protein
MIENTYDSNAIEGSALTLRETALILLRGVTINGKHIRDHLDAIGHQDAFNYMIELADNGSPLTERVIKELHSLVLMRDAKNKGVYRTVEIAILGASRKPPPHYLVREQTEELLRDYGVMKQDSHIIRAVSEFHLRFEGIHPFIDGNGRTGRLILNLELIKAGFLPVNIKFADRDKYYDSFDSFHANGGASDALTRLILAYQEEEILKYAAKIS